MLTVFKVRGRDTEDSDFDGNSFYYYNYCVHKNCIIFCLNLFYQFKLFKKPHHVLLYNFVYVVVCISSHYDNNNNYYFFNNTIIIFDYRFLIFILDSKIFIILTK